MSKTTQDRTAPLAGKYLLDELLFQEGRASYYRARHRLIERYYSVCLVEAAAFPHEQSRQAFLAAAQKASNVLHQGVLAPADFGTAEDGSLFVAEEQPPGRSLSTLLADSGALNLKRALSLFKQVLAGTAAAHDHAVVHGAINASSVFVQDDLQGAETARLCGLGCYLPAEVGSRGGAESDLKAGKKQDTRALGLLLYSMLTGRPVPAETPPADLHLPRTAPAWLTRLTIRAAGGQYADAGEMLRELNSAVDLHDLPTPAEPLPVVRAPLVPLPIICLLVGVLCIGAVLFAMLVRPAPAPTRVYESAAERDREAENDPLCRQNAPGAEELMRQSKYAEALKAYNVEIPNAIKSGARAALLSRPYEHRAECHGRLKQFAEALADFQSALKIRLEEHEQGKDVVSDYANIAACFIMLRRPDEAQPMLEEAVRARNACVAAGGDRYMFPDDNFVKNAQAQIAFLRQLKKGSPMAEHPFLTTETKKRTR